MRACPAAGGQPPRSRTILFGLPGLRAPRQTFPAEIDRRNAEFWRRPVGPCLVSGFSRLTTEQLLRILRSGASWQHSAAFYRSSSYGMLLAASNAGVSVGVVGAARGLLTGLAGQDRQNASTRTCCRRALDINLFRRAAWRAARQRRSRGVSAPAGGFDFSCLKRERAR